MYRSRTHGTLYGPVADYAEQREAEAERDQAARGGSPLYRKLGAAPLGDDYGRAYRMAGRGGAGPRGNAATSTMDRVNAIDTARDISNYSKQMEDREFAANRAGAMERAQRAAVERGGGGPPSPGAGVGGPVAGARTGGNLADVFGGAGSASMTGAAPRGAPSGNAGGMPPSLAGAGGVAGGSPQQTAAYKAGMAQGPNGAGFNPGAGGPDGRGFASDMQTDPYGSLESAMMPIAAPSKPSMRIDDTDLQMMLAQDRGQPIDRAVAEALSTSIGGYDLYDATGGNRERRLNDALTGGLRGDAEREAAMLEAALKSPDANVRAAVESVAPEIQRAAQEAALARQAVLRESRGAPSQWEEDQTNLENSWKERDFGLRERGVKLDEDMARMPKQPTPPRVDQGAILESYEKQIGALRMDAMDPDLTPAERADAVKRIKGLESDMEAFRKSGGGGGFFPNPGDMGGTPEGGISPEELADVRRAAAEDGIPFETALEDYRAARGF